MSGGYERLLESRRHREDSQKCYWCRKYLIADDDVINLQEILLHEECADMLGYNEVKNTVRIQTAHDPSTISRRLLERIRRQLPLELKSDAEIITCLFRFDDIFICRSCDSIKRVNIVEVCDKCWNSKTPVIGD